MMSVPAETTRKNTAPKTNRNQWNRSVLSSGVMVLISAIVGSQILGSSTVFPEKFTWTDTWTEFSAISTKSGRGGKSRPAAPRRLTSISGNGMALRRESQSPGHCRAKLATGSAGVACVNCGRKVIRVVRLKDIKALKAASIRLRREVQKK